MALPLIQINPNLGQSLKPEKQESLLDILDKGLGVAAKLAQTVSAVQEIGQAPERLKIQQGQLDVQKRQVASQEAEQASQATTREGQLKLQSSEIANKKMELEQKASKDAEEIQQKKFQNTKDLFSERKTNKIIQNAQLSSVNLGRVKELYDQALAIDQNQEMSPDQKNIARQQIDNAMVVAFKQVGEPGSIVTAGEAAGFKSSAWANTVLRGLFGQYNPNDVFNKTQLDSLLKAADVQLRPHIAAATKIDNAIELQARRNNINVDELALYDYGGEGQPQAVNISEAELKQTKPGVAFDQYRKELQQFNLELPKSENRASNIISPKPKLRGGGLLGLR